MSDLKNNDISLKRYAARIAMEGEAERVRREAEEKIAKDKELVEETAKQKELDKKAAEERAMKDKREEEEREKRSAIKASTEIKSEIEKIKSVGAQVGSLRTLKRDMDQMILDQSISLARIAMEEDARKRKSSDTRGREGIKNWAMIIASIVFITFGIGVGGYLYFNYYREQATVEKPADLIKKTKVPIVVESQKELSLSGMSSEKTISEIKNSILESSVTAGSIQKIILTKRTPTDEVIEITSQDFFSAIKSSISSETIRSLNSEMLFGVLNTITGAKSGIMVFMTESYQNSFAGMLKWEKGSMVKDIYEIIKSVPANDYLITKNFEDLILNNQDTRVLKNENGEIVLVYGFLNGRELIIAGNTNVFNEIVNRLINSPNK
ncbi:MAG: hypothetical protein UT05_C0010G0043 [Parcubacteria group bacterium GW2011_GWF2_38_76]|nr:MAG: hypothetical protein UT05_C0010G0043 [Parcubacteria group bacterium GW2011_GWF2_38_76]HBM45526.1 hypothetical protein [Patescibacteria group bacterium]